MMKLGIEEFETASHIHNSRARPLLRHTTIVFSVTSPSSAITVSPNNKNNICVIFNIIILANQYIYSIIIFTELVTAFMI
jgi:hypothetical protein